MTDSQVNKKYIAQFWNLIWLYTCVWVKIMLSSEEGWWWFRFFLKTFLNIDIWRQCIDSIPQDEISWYTVVSIFWHTPSLWVRAGYTPGQVASSSQGLHRSNFDTSTCSSTAAGSSDRNHKTKDSLGRRGEAEVVEGDLQHNPGSHQTKFLLQRPPCVCHTATDWDVWAALPYIPCPCSECHCEGMSQAGRQSSRTVSHLWESRVQGSAVVLWHCTRFCRDTTSRRHFLRLWLCWTFSLPLPWPRLKLNSVLQCWRESRCSCAMQWARNVWMHRPCSPGTWLISMRRLYITLLLWKRWAKC